MWLTSLQRAERWLGAAFWRLLGATGEAGRHLPGLAVGTVALVGLLSRPPSHPARLAPARAHPAGDGAQQLAQVDEILSRKAPGLGLELRHRLSRALTAESRAAHLDPLLVLAVMRVESEFDEDATSVRGARGLMQIRPSTLAFLAGREGIRLDLEEIERDPVLSTQLAVRYLGYLNRRFHGDLNRVLMAYNAGPHRLVLALRNGDADRFQSYPARVKRTWRVLRSLPPADDAALADRAALLALPAFAQND